MAWQIKKRHTSQGLTTGVEPQETILRTTFLVYEDDPAYDGSQEDVWNVLNSIKVNTAPFDAIKPVGTRLTTKALDGSKAQLIVTDINIDVEPSRPNAYVVTQTAKAPIVGLAPYRGIKISTQTQNRIVAQYIRPGATSFPANGDVTWPASSLIANGTVTNVMGNPISYAVSQEVIRIEFLNHDPESVGYTNVPANPAEHVNKRNSATFLGLGIGQVLFASYERRYVTDQTSMEVYTFINDPWFHLEQMILRNPVDGSIWNDSSQTIAGETVKVSGRAVWFQPYSDTKVNFVGTGVILPTEIINLLTTPLPTYA
jgi:hypothetical protein